MINYKLKAIVNDLLCVDDEKGLKIELFRNLRRLLYEDATFEDCEELRSAFETIAKAIW